MSWEEILIKKCERGMRTLIEESKPKSKTSFKIRVEVEDDPMDGEGAEVNSWLHFNNLFKEKWHPTRSIPGIIQPRVIL